MSFYFAFISCNRTVEAPVSSVTDENNIELSNSPNCQYEHLSVSMRSPTTINQTVDLINELPKPLTLPCFIKSLARPLKVNLTLSRLSAQPAVGNDSPRVFIFNDNLILAITTSGEASNLLELSQMYTDRNSLKSELKFPILHNINYQTGYDRINLGNKTTCSDCHSNEKIDDSIFENGAYTSTALKPESTMPLSTFIQEFYKCQLMVNTDRRCDLIMSLLNNSDLEEVDFPENTPKWIDTIAF